MDKIKIKKESPSKQNSVKSDKTNVKKNVDTVKKVEDPQNIRQYAVISPESIKLLAESSGISELSDEVSAALAEDISYKLREVVHNCSILTNNNKRRKLLTEDVNKVLDSSNTPVVYGHSFSHGLGFTHIPKAEVFVEEDTEIDIVAMACVITDFTKCGDEYVKGMWVLPDPAEKGEPVKEVKEEPSTSKQETRPNSPQLMRPPAPPPPRPGDTATPLAKPPSHFINYYLQWARVVIGGSEPHLRVALADLRSNSKIGPLVPYFLNLVALSVNKLQRHGKLTDALLRTIEALVDNPHVDPSSQLAVNRAVNALLVVAIEPKTARNCDDLLLRKRAAHLLAKVLVCWSIEQKQQIDIVRQLLQLLLDGSTSLKSHYGAVVSLTALGHRTLDTYFWPILDRYVTVLEEQKTSPADAQDVQLVKGAILVAVEKTYRRSKNLLTPEDFKKRQKIEYKLYDFLGDALIPRYNLRTATGSVFPGTEIVINSEMESKEKTNFAEVDLKIRESLFKTQSTSQSRFPFKPDNRVMMPKLHMYSVFSLSPYAFRQPKEIMFNFIGSNQINPSKLKRRKIGEFLQTEHSSNHYRFAQLWRHQNGLKKTRSIKYCSPSHKKSSVGDLLVFI